MEVAVSVSCCCWVAKDCEMAAWSFVQVTVVAGPPEEIQVRVLDSKSYSMGDMILAIPVNRITNTFCVLTVSNKSYSVDIINKIFIVNSCVWTTD